MLLGQAANSVPNPPAWIGSWIGLVISATALGALLTRWFTRSVGKVVDSRNEALKVDIDKKHEEIKANNERRHLEIKKELQNNGGSSFKDSMDKQFKDVGKQLEGVRSDVSALQTEVAGIKDTMPKRINDTKEAST